MPLVHCSSCHHEWECTLSEVSWAECDWCGKPAGRVLKERTEFEDMVLSGKHHKIIQKWRDKK